MNDFFHTLKRFLRGHISGRRFIAIAVVLAIIWVVATSLSGVVETEAANLWTNIPVQLRILCAVTPLVALLAFSMGVFMSEKARSDQRSANDKKGNDQTGPVWVIEADDFTGACRDFSIGELLSQRVRVKDGEIPPAQFASLVLFHLNQKDINTKAARRLLRGFDFDVRSMEGNVYTLIKKS